MKHIGILTLSLALSTLALADTPKQNDAECLLISRHMFTSSPVVDCGWNSTEVYKETDQDKSPTRINYSSDEAYQIALTEHKARQAAEKALRQKEEAEQLERKRFERLECEEQQREEQEAADAERAKIQALYDSKGCDIVERVQRQIDEALR